MVHTSRFYASHWKDGHQQRGLRVRTKPIWGGEPHHGTRKEDNQERNHPGMKKSTISSMIHVQTNMTALRSVPSGND